MINTLVAPLRHLRQLVAPDARYIALFLVLGLMATLVEGVGIGLLIPLLQGEAPLAGTSSPVLRWLNDATMSIPAEHRVSVLIVLILSAMLLKALLAYSFTLLAQWISSRGRRRIGQALFSQVLRVSQSHLDRQPAGSLLHILTAGPSNAEASVLALLWLLLSVATIVVFAALLTAVAWPLMLAALSVALVVALVVRFTTHRINEVGARSYQRETELTQQAREGLLGMTTIRAFGREADERGRYERATRHAHHERTRAAALIALAHPLSELLGATLVVALVALALRMDIELSVLVAMAFMLYRLQPQLQNANANLARIANLQATVEAALDLMNEEDKPYPRSGEIRPSPLSEGIRFEAVDFAYDERGPALQQIDCLIERGKTTALVGHSGAGKSTLANLICGFYEATAGHIRVDGTDLYELDMAAWRSRLALVSQDIHIFNTTVRENILYSRPEASETELFEAASRAHAHEFIADLPQGYDTVVGERGLRLSGGQRQRLSIARAFLRDPEILILDEATNALDAISEAHIQAALADLGKGRTQLIIAHRLSTIRHADHILVMDQGRIVEQGDFSQLMAGDGLFSELYRTQHDGVIE